MHPQITPQLTELISKIRLSDRRSWILMVPNSIGEVAIVCGFAKSFVETHGYGVTLLISELHHPVTEMYPGRFNAVFHVPYNVMRDFSNYGVIPPNHFDVDFPFNTWPLQYGDGRLMKLHDLYTQMNGRGGLSLTDIYRYILRLDWSAPLERARLTQQARQQAEQIARQHGVVKGKSVILFPGCNSNQPAPYAFWLALIKQYKQKGLKVFSSFAGASLLPGEMPFPGTHALSLPIDLALAVSEYAGHMVLSVSGLASLALLSGIDCNVSIVMTDRFTEDPAQGFRPFNPLQCSTMLGLPEFCIGRDNFSEWVVSVEEAEPRLREIACDLVEGRASDARLDYSRLFDLAAKNRSLWAHALVC